MERGAGATHNAAVPRARPSIEQILGQLANELANQLATGTTLSGPDPEVERDPPPKALEVLFPKVTMAQPVRWSDDHPPPNYQQLFASLQRPEAILPRHLKALNFNHHCCTSGDALLPLRDDNAPYTPPKSSTDRKFAERIAELDITNDAAFRALSKTTKPGEKAPRLMNMRKFWTHLDNMSQYWDTTADQYYTIDGAAESNEPGNSTTSKPVSRYKGRRTANGRDMPDTYRADTVNAFVEGVTAAFNCRVSQPYIPQRRMAPTLQVSRLDQPVRLTSIIMRLPADRDRARVGIMEGPLLGILERNTIDFSDETNNNTSSRKSEHDLLREIGAMLFIAQQRAHEGQNNSPAQDESKWYTTKPRWGGGPGSKNPQLQQCEDELAEIVARLAENPADSKDLEAQRVDVRKKLKRAYDNAKAWTTVKSGASRWHEKTDYKAIGKTPGSPYDEVSIEDGSSISMDIY